MTRRRALLFAAGITGTLCFLALTAKVALWAWGFDNLPREPSLERGMTVEVRLYDTIVFATPDEAELFQRMGDSVFWLGPIFVALALLTSDLTPRRLLAPWQRAEQERRDWSEVHGRGELPRLRRIAFALMIAGFVVIVLPWNPAVSRIRTPVSGQTQPVYVRGRLGYATPLQRMLVEAQDFLPATLIFFGLELLIVAGIAAEFNRPGRTG